MTNVFAPLPFHRFPFLLAMAALAALPAANLAAAPPSGRSVGDYVVYAPEYSDPATLTTHFGFEQGLALLRLPEVSVQGVDQPQEVALTGLVESIDVGARLNERMALEARFEGQTVVGTNSTSAFHIGGTFGASGEGHAALRLFRDRSLDLQIVGRAGLRLTDGRQIQPSAIVQRVLDDPEGSAADVASGRISSLLVRRETGQMTFGSISAAKGFWRRFVLQTSAEVRAGRATLEITGRDREIETGVTRQRFALGAALSAHARPVLPVALQVEYRLSYLLQNPDRSVALDEVVPQDTVSAGLFLAGWPDLTLGLRASTLLRRDRLEHRRFWFGQFVMRYFFGAP